MNADLLRLLSIMQEPHLSARNVARIVAVSIAIDLIQAALDLVPVIGWAANIAIDFAAWGILYWMFRRHGVKFNTFERFMYFNSGFILDLVPFANVFAWTLDVALVVMSVKQAERRVSGTAGGEAD